MMKHSARGISSFVEIARTRAGVKDPCTKIRSTVIAGNASSRTDVSIDQLELLEETKCETYFLRSPPTPMESA